MKNKYLKRNNYEFNKSNHCDKNNRGVLMKKNIYLSTLFILLTFFWGQQPAQADTSTKEIQSLEYPELLFQSGTSRGKYHDKQDLGIVMSPGSTIKIRKKRTDDGYKNLKFWLLGNKEKEEQQVTLTTEWKTIKTDYAGVPFVNTPYGGSGSEVEYEITGSTVTLPIYQSADKESDFFANWDQSKAPFSLIKGHNFQLLIPFDEKERIKKLPTFTNLNEYIDYQDGIIDYYDELIGLSSDDFGVNKKPHNRFFLKADGSARYGIGAYYGSDYAANGRATVVDMWMTKNAWGTFHEIGHAYQPYYNSKGISTGEVSNNLMAILYLSKYSGKEYVENSSWLFSYDQKQSVEENLYTKIWEQGMSYSSMNDLRANLTLLTAVIQTGGPEAWMKLNQEWRVAVDQKNQLITNMQTAEYFNYFYSKEFQQDFTPVFLQWGITFDRSRIEAINRSKEYSPVAPIAAVVPKNRLNEATQQLPGSIMDSVTNVVSNHELKKVNLAGGSLTIQLKIDDFNQIKGQKLRIKDGKTIVKEVGIDSPTVKIDHLENGAYTVDFPKTSNIYEIDDYYVYIKDAQNQKVINFKRYEKSKLLDETIMFRGLGDREFAKFQTNFNLGIGTFNVTSDQPHSYYPNEKYAAIDVQNEQGISVFSKEMDGTKVKKSFDTFPLKEGYKVAIFHDETKGRLVSSTSDLINKNSKTNTFVVKNNQLMNVVKGDDGQKRLEQKIDEAVANLEKDPELSEVDRSNEKNQIYLGILDLPDEKREQYLEKYQDFLDIKPGNIIINYADEAGKKLSESTIYKNGRFGEILNLEPKKIEGFNYVTTGNKLSFKYRLEEQEKTLVYNKITEDNLTQTIEGKDGETIAEVITRGNLGEIDSTNPDTPLPEGDNRWLKVILPTAVVFESDQDKSNITSPKNYQIKNKSGRPIKVDILTYEIMGGNGVAALNTLNIQRSAGYQGTTVIPLVNNGGTKNKYDIQKEFVRLANSQGDYDQMKGTGIKEISFEFTGTADLSKLEEEQNYIESKLTFKFIPLQMNGKTVEEINK